MNTIAASIPVLRWAAQRARLDDDSVTRRFAKWPLWLSGEEQPTLKQLEDFARLTHTSIGYFFLPQPPTLTLPVPDFRTLRDITLAEPSSELLDTIYLCQQRQDWYRDHARMHGLLALPFIGSVNIDDAPQAVAQRLREVLDLSVALRRQLPTWTEALRQMIGKAEDAGVLVMVSSVVGSNSRRTLDVGEFRGFALSDPLAPLIFLNGADSKAAQMFTLAHELRTCGWVPPAYRTLRPAKYPSKKLNVGATWWQRNCWCPWKTCALHASPALRSQTKYSALRVSSRSAPWSPCVACLMSATSAKLPCGSTTGKSKTACAH